MTPHFGDTKHIQTQVNLETHRALHLMALDRGISLTLLVRIVLEDWISSQETKKEAVNG
jgi:predicted HicB family RNase H-like nuclease